MVFNAIDTDSSHRISVEEFVEWCWISKSSAALPSCSPSVGANHFPVGDLDGALVLTPPTHRRTLIYLLGAFQQANDYADSIDHGLFQVLGDCKVVVPQAPTRQFQLPLGIPGVPDERLVPCWFNYPQDKDTAEASVDQICSLIREEAKLVGEANVHLAGFSQGASIAWVIFAKQLAAIGSFTSYCSGPGLGSIVKAKVPSSINVPAMMCIGTEDQIFSPASTACEMRELRSQCDTTSIRIRAQEGVGHVAPNADGFRELASFVQAVDRRRRVTQSTLSDGSLVLMPAPSERHRRTLIFLHGAFENVRRYGTEVERGRFLPPAECKIVFPQAPTRKLNLPQGIPGVRDERVAPCWYNFPQDKPTAAASIDRICSLVREEAKIVGEANVHLAGFSQGASIAWVIFMKQLVSIGSFTSFCASPGLGSVVKADVPNRIAAPALVYVGSEDAIFSPATVLKEVAALGGSCDVSRISMLHEDGLGHELPGASGFAAMVDFLDRVG
eukprot:TRINITY_DN26741_c0_g3_i2.p1 TRINITY_DN26741_c0_g3~~TRINITY_DN26741_c0_g3_i2.p1  ORF type:complete len:560 (+),score=93.87 TRINITY_DN26741_c0_g3_i2:182-1681(+)